MMIKQAVLQVFTVILFPYVLAYKFSSKKKEIDLDVIAMASSYKVNYSGSVGLIYFLLVNRYYRNIYYNRIGNISLCLKLLLRKDKYFDPCENIGGGIYPAHPYSTIINAASVGSNFTVHQCTTIGNKKDGDNNAIPTIGKNVNVGANVCIIGNISIGDNVIIGAGSVVINDIPSFCIAAGNPAKVIKIIGQ